MKSQHRSRKVNDPTARTAPEIPADIQQLTPTAEVLADAEISFRECLIENFSFKDRSYKSAVFEGCILKHLDFSRSSLRKTTVDGCTSDRMRFCERRGDRIESGAGGIHKLPPDWPSRN